MSLSDLLKYFWRNMKRRTGRVYRRNVRPCLFYLGVFFFGISICIWWHLSTIDNAKKSLVTEVEAQDSLSLEAVEESIQENQSELEGIQKEIETYGTEQDKMIEVKAALEQKDVELVKKKEDLEVESKGNESKIASLKKELAKLSSPSVSGKRIDVDISEQKLVAYDGYDVVRSYTISSGEPGRDTPLGSFKISNKYGTKTYSGSDYYYPNTKWNMRYSGPYLIHTAWWHNDFGTPVSHGCINMKESEAGWLYQWAPIGTPVVVHG